MRKIADKIVTSKSGTQRFATKACVTATTIAFATVFFCHANSIVAQDNSPDSAAEPSVGQMGGWAFLVPVKHQWKNRSTILSGLAFRIDEATVKVVVPNTTRSIHLTGDWSARLKPTSGERYEPARRAVPIVSNVVRKSKTYILEMEATDFPSMEEGDLNALEPGSSVEVYLAELEQEDDFGIVLTVKSAQVETVERDSSGNVLQFSIKQPSDDVDKLALVLDDAGKILGVISPQPAPRVDAYTTTYLTTTAEPLSTFFETRMPIIIESFGYWTSTTDERQLHGFVVTDRPIDTETELLLKKMEVKKFLYRRNLDNDNFEVPMFKLGKKAEFQSPTSRMELHSDSDSLGKQLFPLSRIDESYSVYRFSLDVSIDETEEYKPALFLPSVSLVNQVDDEQIVSNVFQPELAHYNWRQTPAMSGTEFSTHVDRSFKVDHKLTSESSSFVETDSIARFAVEKFPSPIERKGIIGKQSGQGLTEITSGPRFKMSSITPDLFFSADETVCWMVRFNGETHVLSRVELPSLKVTHELIGFQGSVSHSSEGLIITRPEGCYVINPDTLQEERLLKITGLKQVVASPKSHIAYGLAPQFLIIIDLKNGRPVHRIPNRFNSSNHVIEADFKLKHDYECESLQRLAISNDGNYLFACSSCVSRFRIEGSDLIFEERSPFYLDRRKFCRLWLSSDNRHVGVFGTGYLPDISKTGITRAPRDHGELFQISDLSKPVRSVPTKISRGLQELGVDGVEDRLENAIYVQYLPKSGRILMHTRKSPAERIYSLAIFDVPSANESD